MAFFGVIGFHWKKRRILPAIVVCAALLAILLPVKFACQTLSLLANGGQRAERTILLDPGHGGIDPGAIGVNHAQEKDINLAIALVLRDMLQLVGYRVIMTRDTDIATHDTRVTGIAAIKSSDLNNRLKLLREYSDSPAVLIHQNKFLQEKYHGAQMFYGRKSPESERLAACLQQAICDSLQPENKRTIKRSTSAVYVLHNADNPVVLAECGFLSNAAEAALLCDEDYQRRVAFALFCGITEYMKGQEAAEDGKK